MGRGLRVYRVAFHCHSRLSHDSEGTFDEIAAAAKGVGINAVILNDHYEPGNIDRAPRGFVDGVLFIPGVELRAMGGSLLAFGMRGDFEKKTAAAGLAERFRAEGGLAVAGHVERIERWGEVEIDGFEIYNLHAEFAAMGSWAILWRFLFLPADCFFESAITVPEENLRAWDRLLASGERLFPLAGCDAHANVRVFGRLGGVIGTYPEILRLFSNHVLAAELREDLLLDAIRRGRVYSVFDHLGDASGFAASLGNPDRHPDRGARALIGESFPHDPGAILEVEAPLSAEIRIIRNGEVLERVEGSRFSGPLPGPGVYRVEVRRGGRLWIAAAPFYVEPAAGAGRGP